MNNPSAIFTPQSDTDHLKKIIRILAACAEALDYTQNKTQISVDQFASGIFVPLRNGKQKPFFFLIGECFQL